jgi:hypothetical protein
MSTQQSRSDIIIVFDSSGSMQTMGNEPMQAINSFISGQKGIGNNSTVSLYTFDSKVTCVYKELPLSEVKELTEYNPEGMTALYDGICTAINDKLSTGEHLDNVTLVVVTDGVENCSRKYEYNEWKELTDRVQSGYNWTIEYLAADPKIFAKSIGININGPRVCVAGYDQKTPGGLTDLMRQKSAQILLKRSASISTPTITRFATK